MSQSYCLGVSLLASWQVLLELGLELMLRGKIEQHRQEIVCLVLSLLPLMKQHHLMRYAVCV